MKKVAVYYRKSTSAQEFHSQKHAVEEWLKNNNIDKKDTLTFEDSATGTNLNRKGLQDMMQAAKDGLVSDVVVWKYDRFGRINSVMKLVLELDEYEVGFISVKEEAFNLSHSNPARLILIATLTTVAKMECDNIRSRINAGIAAARARGVELGRKREIDDATREKIKEARFSGKSYRKVATMFGVSVGHVHEIVNGRKERA